MILADLPSEVLDVILQHWLVSFMVVPLWKCGNRLLNIKLEQGGCTRVELEDHNWRTTSRYPKMLRFLRLKHLRIDVGEYHRFMEPEDLARELQRLSPTIETLEFHFRNSEACFLKNTSDLPVSWLFDSILETGDTIPFSLPTSTPKSTIQSRLWPLASYFPKLSKLVLITVRPEFQPEDLQYLPSSLTHLELCQSQRLETQTAYLPRSLVILRFLGVHSVLTELGARNLPPQLEDLSGLWVPQQLVPLLPQTIKRCTLAYRLHFTTFEPDIFPPHWAWLSIDGGESQFGESIWESKLPGSLRELDLHGDIFPSSIYRLPRLLTRLQLVCSHKHLETGPIVWQWPTHLVQLTLRTTFPPTEAICRGLPVSLTTLKWTSVGELATFGWHWLPPRLNSLEFTMDVKLSMQYPSVTQAAMLPSLHTIDISVREILHLDLEQLPCYLRHLRLFPTNFPSLSSQLAALPRTLQTLSLPRLPASSLPLLSMIPLHKISIGQLEGSDEEIFDGFGVLPSSLTSLSYGVKTPYAAKNGLFLQLPRTLRSLCCSCPEPHPAQLIETLPPLLEFLQLHIDHIDDHLVSCLPRTLRYLHTRAVTSSITSKAAIHFPPRLATVAGLIQGYPKDPISPYLRSVKSRLAASPISFPDPRVIIRLPDPSVVPTNQNVEQIE